MFNRKAWVGVGLMAGMVAPGASATYYNYSTLSAYENGVLVAQAYGTHGMDFTYGTVGGRHTVRDVRPGGSPVYGKVWFQYTDNAGQVGAWQQVSAPYNYTSSWVTRTATTGLSLNYKYVSTKPQVCQHDDWSPDDCATGSKLNHKI